MTPRYLLEGMVREYRESRSGRRVEALRVPRLEVPPGEILAVVGPNGSGKSTLLETMAFLQPPEEGRILLDGRAVWSKAPALAARQQCPLLIQRTVLFRMSVLKNVMYGLRMRGLGRVASRRRAEAVLRRVQLDKLAHRGPRELSGGERRRVALARVLALEPNTLLLDEPTAHVDRANAARIEEIVLRIHADTGTTVILASHDLRQARRLAHRVVTLIDGQLIPATVENLFRGTLRPDRHGFAFRHPSGLSLAISSPAAIRESGPAWPASETSVQIAIDAQRLEVLPAGAGEAEPLAGRIEAVEAAPGRCRLYVRLAGGQGIHADMARPDYQRLGLNLGEPVRLRLGRDAVRLVRVEKER